MHRFDAGIAFDGDDTRRLTLSDGAVLVVDAAEECCIERFEAVLIFTGDGGSGLVALPRAGLASWVSAEKPPERSTLARNVNKLAHFNA